MVPWGGHAVQKPWLKQNQFPRYPQPTRYSQPGFQPRYQPQYGHQRYNAYGPAYLSLPPQPPWRPRNPAPTVPPSFRVDETARYTGTVKFYAKWKGFGFIDVAQDGVVPNNNLFVHWKSLCSDDRFPFMQKGMEVEFSLQVQREWHRPGPTVRAKNVSMVGGMNLALQDDLDAQEKAFVGGQHLRYTGTLKFFTPRHGFGWVIMDQGYDVDPSVPSELKVETAEVNAGGQQPRFMQNLAVEFGIWRTLRGEYKVYNMTLPGGHPLTQDALENRISMGPQTFSGDVMIWNWRQGWGFIRVDPHHNLPPRVLAKLAQQQEAARQRGKHITNDRAIYFRRADVAPGFMVMQNQRVAFSLYIDDKGAGACDIRRR